MAQEIQQVKNYQVNQTLVDSTRNKAIMDELAAVKTRQEELFYDHVNEYNMIRQEQKFLGKEILDVKKYQMSAVTMGSGSSSSPPPQRYEPDQALMKIREQHANFSACYLGQGMHLLERPTRFGHINKLTQTLLRCRVRRS
ncbi:hypothetical protein PIB30_086272 [Stylosanthes scabra]|uniref:Uncharacterized protein n=1 Tax=Stylosanthes scabra TaxID=79078 RepID=A0ABU6RTQ8_9FABA|nr:hypothetical protein [Stylosanthes scabra]